MPSKPNLYALFVGINQYHPDSNVVPLAGCANDIQRFSALLSQHFSQAYTINSKILLNEAAIYQNIIDHFGEKHLLKAGSEDTILFYYSGHGAREKAASAFKEYFPEELEETIVCYDSRTPGGHDLADKELAVIISRLAANCPNVIIIMDCCHSGSGTRGLDDFELGQARQTYDRDEERPLDSYIGGYYKTQLEKEGRIQIPSSRHLLLSACRNSEKAFELSTREGLFTSRLISILENTPQVSYANLFSRCRVAMRQIARNQNPQFESYEQFNAQQYFLSNTTEKSIKKYLLYRESGTWWVECGAIHGLPTDPDKVAQFEVYQEEKLVGHAASVMVDIQKSQVNLEFEAKPGANYRAVLTSLPVPPVLVDLQFGKGGEDRLEAAYQSPDDAETVKKYHPIHFSLEENLQAPKYRLTVGNQVEIINVQTNVALRTIKGDDDAEVFEDAFQFLEHLAQWEKMLSLQNDNTQLDPSNIEFILEDLHGEQMNPANQDTLILDAPKMEEGFDDVSFRLKIRNDHSHKLQVSLFYFSPDYGLYSIESKEIPGGATATFIDGDTFAIIEGQVESTDIFKVFVGTQKMDTYLLEMEMLELGQTVTYQRTRELGAQKALGSKYKKQKKIKSHDWLTKRLTIRTIGCQDKVGTKSVELAGGKIKIKAHASLKANLGLTTLPSGTRDIESGNSIVQLLHNKGGDLLNLSTSTRDIYGSPNVLEISEIENEAALKSAPLEIEIDAGLTETDALIPLTFDGDHLLPIGQTSTAPDGRVHISIDTIPDTQEVKRRSLFKALKLYFLKTKIKDSKVRQLRWVDYSQLKAVRRSANVSEKIAKANRILLCIHGIIGDTQGQADFARAVCNSNGEEGLPFDLVLTFDYENLNTRIEVTASELKKELEKAGIEAGGNKKITILAHSMGGLVSRYFIEMLGGKKVVNTLVMAGTPNAGSAIGKIVRYRDTGLTLLGFLLNFLQEVPFVGTVVRILEGTKELTVTLGQMDIDSKDNFLKNLNQAGDPGIPYHIVAGHLGQFMERNTQTKSLMNKLLKLGGKAFFDQTPNDIAVSVDSIKSVDINRQPTPEKKDVACHHLNYFEETESVNLLNQLLGLPTRASE